MSRFVDYNYLANDGETKQTPALKLKSRGEFLDLLVAVPDDGEEKAGLSGSWVRKPKVGPGTVPGSYEGS